MKENKSIIAQFNEITEDALSFLKQNTSLLNPITKVVEKIKADFDEPMIYLTLKKSLNQIKNPRATCVRYEEGGNVEASKGLKLILGFRQSGVYMNRVHKFSDECKLWFSTQDVEVCQKIEICYYFKPFDSENLIDIKKELERWQN